MDEELVDRICEEAIADRVNEVREWLQQVGRRLDSEQNLLENKLYSARFHCEYSSCVRLDWNIQARAILKRKWRKSERQLMWLTRHPDCWDLAGRLWVIEDIRGTLRYIERELSGYHYAIF